jgi:hypothetical protein
MFGGNSPVIYDNDIMLVRSELETAKARLEYVRDLMGYAHSSPSKISIAHPKFVHDTAILELQTVLTGMCVVTGTSGLFGDVLSVRTHREEMNWSIPTTLSNFGRFVKCNAAVSMRPRAIDYGCEVVYWCMQTNTFSAETQRDGNAYVAPTMPGAWWESEMRDVVEGKPDLLLECGSSAKEVNVWVYVSRERFVYSCYKAVSKLYMILSEDVCVR